MKIRVLESKYKSKRPFMVYYGKEKLAQFSSKDLANNFASMYLVPPHTMQTNVWYN